MSEEDHKLYEQRRVLEPGCDEYNRILQLQLKLYSDMEYPENIADLEKIWRTSRISDTEFYALIAVTELD